jgi:hypothetical protein
MSEESAGNSGFPRWGSFYDRLINRVRLDKGERLNQKDCRLDLH